MSVNGAYTSIYSHGCGHKIADSAMITLRKSKSPNTGIYCSIWQPARQYLINFAGQEEQTIQAINENELINYNIGYVPWDLYLLESLGPATIAIFFDEAFPRSLVEHICRVLVKPSTTLRAAVFFKPSKQPNLIKRIAEWGNLVQVATVKHLSKMIGGEGNTAYVYTRDNNRKEGQKRMVQDKQGLSETAMVDKDLAPASSEDQQGLPEADLVNKHLLSEADMVEKYLAPAWGKDRERLTHYTVQKYEAEKNLPGKDCRHITSLDCMAGTWRKCAKACARCAVIFNHQEKNHFAVKDSTIVGKGLFTEKRILKGGVLLLEYEGDIIPKAEFSESTRNSAVTMCLDKSRYIQACTNCANLCNEYEEGSKNYKILEARGPTTYLEPYT